MFNVTDIKEIKYFPRVSVLNIRIWDYGEDNFVHVDGEWGRWRGKHSYDT